jgi:L-malate glycosyltransferase
VECHQILVGAAPGDAITTEALRLQQALRALGPSEIFAQHRDTEMLGAVHHLSEYDRVVSAAPRDVVLVLHASIAEPAVFEFVMARRERLVVRYHNITPAHFFAPYGQGFVALLSRGREELAALGPRAARAVADSHYNEAELRALGYATTSVVPLVTDTSALVAAVPDASLPAMPATGDTPVLLFVGRVAPNKGHRWCMEALHVLQTYREPMARLVFAGGGEVQGYRSMLNRAADELGLRCSFTGKVSIRQLAALYRRADVFVCLSEHEGFGAPLVEAMAFGLPVVAWNMAAVGETVGDAAVLLEDRAPELVAEAVCRVTSDAELRATLVSQGRRRAEQLGLAAVLPQLVDQLLHGC